MNIIIDIPTQTLSLFDDAGGRLHQYAVSTAANGVGEQKGSEQTPRGLHVVHAKIGDGLPVNTVFVAREPTGEIYKTGMREQFPDRDWILTRILWLSGTEPGKNHLGDVDTLERYIYIHGAPDELQWDNPGSRGCIRMRNKDLIHLYDQVSVGCLVDIKA